MKTKYILFACTICLLSAGAVLFAILGESETITATKQSQTAYEYQITPVAAIAETEGEASLTPETNTALLNTEQQQYGTTSTTTNN